MQELLRTFKLEFESSFAFSKGPDKIAFEHAVKIYLNKPQVVNKWLAGSINSEPIDLDLNLDKSKYEFIFKQFLSKSNKIFQNITYLIIFDFKSEHFVLFFPIIDSNNLTAKYASISFVHLIQFDKIENKLKLFVQKTEDEKFLLQTHWLVDNLLPKLHNWSLNVNFQDENFHCAKLNTLTLYDSMINDYNLLYQKLKPIYWQKFSPDWFELTNTNPEKFIIEDVSIACYFILAWKYLGVIVKNFVDLGCGNGLLVYILNDQGFNGYGVDMRKRRIWSNENFLKANTKLVEKTIDPKKDTYEECDWLIGNHSDELSPWLPCIAYRSAKVSKQNCNIMLIPCCFFDFNSKYDVKKINESRFDTYLNYLSQIFDTFCFKLYKDKLRIPSTRNVCLIGLGECENFIKDENEILNNIQTNLGQSEFKARDLELEKEKSSRNCTKNVDNQLKVYIVQKVLATLLDNSKGECKFVQKLDGTQWNLGKSICLGEIANLFDKNELLKLKLECGGIKTLLKNYHQLFLVENKDQLRLKNPDNQDDNKRNPKQDKKIYAKTKQCLFDLYHPDGCLLDEKDCLFLHK